MIYPLTIYVLSKVKRKEHKYDEDYVQDISIIIPCYNEEKVIGTKLDNTLKLKYPENLLHVIVIDDGSVDGTRKIVEGYLNKGITLFAFDERKGKAAAMNYALGRVESSVIITTDADTSVDSMAIKNLIKHFSDPQVGIVSGNSLVKIPVANTEVAGRDFLTTYESFLEQKESCVDSTASSGGQLMAIRTNLARFDESSIAEDFDCLLNARVNGYRTITEQKSFAWEYAPTTQHDVFVHQRRMSTGAIQTLFKYRRVLLNPKYGLFGLVILPGHRLSQVLNPWFLLLTILFSSSTYFLAPKVIFSVIIVFELLWVITSALSLKLRMKTSPLGYLNYFSIIQCSLLMSWIDFFRRKYNVKWEKIESTRLNGIPK